MSGLKQVDTGRGHFTWPAVSGARGIHRLIGLIADVAEMNEDLSLVMSMPAFSHAFDQDVSESPSSIR